MTTHARPRLLDLFCGAGGAAMGYHRAGFDVVGVDIRPQPNYPFEFVQADALEYLAGTVRPWTMREQFDVIHASPPCQAYSVTRNINAGANGHPDLIGPVRELLEQTGLPYVIENVPGAPLRNSVTVCGAAMGLRTGRYDLARHRLFETSFPVMVPPCAHGSRPVLGVYGDHARDRRRDRTASNPEAGTQLKNADGLAQAREAMEMPWANWRELSQAVPPAYTELIGHQLLQHLRVAA